MMILQYNIKGEKIMVTNIIVVYIILSLIGVFYMLRRLYYTLDLTWLIRMCFISNQPTKVSIKTTKQKKK